ncbi:hypothetical protein RclHR1_04030010 [Rhizophagus clarus]|uniref:Uncharacterized protein n=1 Tax=Rhizophagus clarus TaxID=94130 RepID=A0A2Z6RRZ6_9GLOM|nr:hypothetical protein RclHR1_04030010 [Rhizophagus clarus]GES85232.1 hypothetical protein GLOIN_2v1672762 [Rhizophagus clarus]
MSFNCHILGRSDTFIIEIYNEKGIKYAMLGNNKYKLTIFNVENILNYICSRHNVDVSVMRKLKLWNINIKKSEIEDKNVSTEEDVKQKLKGNKMEPEGLFKEYFQD